MNKMLINSGIDTFIYRHPYSDTLADEISAAAGIKRIIVD
jgi:deoxycytidylate deaminase